MKKRDRYDGVSSGNFGKESGLNEKEKVDEGKTTKKETVTEKITDESTRGKTICRYVSRRKRLSSIVKEGCRLRHEGESLRLKRKKYPNRNDETVT